MSAQRTSCRRTASRPGRRGGGTARGPAPSRRAGRRLDLHNERYLFDWQRVRSWPPASLQGVHALLEGLPAPRRPAAACWARRRVSRRLSWRHRASTSTPWRRRRTTCGRAVSLVSGNRARRARAPASPGSSRSRSAAMPPSATGRTCAAPLSSHRTCASARSRCASSGGPHATRPTWTPQASRRDGPAVDVPGPPRASRPSSASSCGATSPPICCATSRSSPTSPCARSSRRSPGPRTASRGSSTGGEARPATRWSTPACAPSWPRAGCTTGCVSCALRSSSSTCWCPGRTENAGFATHSSTPTTPTTPSAGSGSRLGRRRGSLLPHLQSSPCRASVTTLGVVRAALAARAGGGCRHGGSTGPGRHRVRCCVGRRRSRRELPGPSRRSRGGSPLARWLHSRASAG